MDRRRFIVGGVVAALTLRTSSASGFATVSVAPSSSIDDMVGFRTGEVKTARHHTSYIESGPLSGPLMIFLHGFPELGIVWKAQMIYFAQRSWRCIVPDMRGYGGSSAPTEVAAYTVREISIDMLELHDALVGAPPSGSVMTGERQSPGRSPHTIPIVAVVSSACALLTRPADTYYRNSFPWSIAILSARPLSRRSMGLRALLPRAICAGEARFRSRYSRHDYRTVTLCRRRCRSEAFVHSHNSRAGRVVWSDPLPTSHDAERLYSLASRF